MTAASRHRRLLLAAALLLVVVVLWWFGRVHGPTLQVAPPPSQPRANATPAAVEPAAAPASAEPKKPAPAAEWREPERRSGVDAANIYKDAFVLFDRLTDEEKKMLRSPKEEVDADAAAALFEKIQPILAKLREAMKADYCDWGLAPYGMETQLRHISPAQDLAKLALWSAAYRLRDDPAAALEDLQTRARLGHHLSDVLIGGLVSVTFETTAVDLLRQNLGGFSAETRAAAVDFVRSSTLDADFGRAFDGEAAMAQRVMEDLLGKDQRELGAMLSGVGATSQSEAEQARVKEVLNLLGDPAKARAEAAYIRSIEEKMSASLTWPEREFQAWWQQTQADLKNGHPFAQLIIPSVAAVQTRVQQRRVERELFAAGVDVLANGPAQLGKYRDPATGGPLQYVPTATGFELRGTYKVKGKPVTLVFPAPAR